MSCGATRNRRRERIAAPTHQRQQTNPSFIYCIGSWISFASSDCWMRHQPWTWRWREGTMYKSEKRRRRKELGLTKGSHTSYTFSSLSSFGPAREILPPTSSSPLLSISQTVFFLLRARPCCPNLPRREHRPKSKGKETQHTKTFMTESIVCNLSLLFFDYSSMMIPSCSSPTKRPFIGFVSISRDATRDRV